MSDTKVKIIQSALVLFTRYGIRRVSMSDVADDAGVSRQTLYSHFKNKEDLCVAVMHEGISLLLAKIESKWADSNSIDEKIDAYFDLAVLEAYRTLDKNPDLRDLQQGVGKATFEVAKELEGKKVAMLAGQFEEFEDVLKKQDSSPLSLAQYIIRTSNDLKYSVENMDQLSIYLGTLRNAVLAMLNAK